MKFAHIADVHIGCWRDPRLKELSSLAFIKAIDDAISEKVDFILIAGDLFNTALPGIDQIKTVIRKLKHVKKAKIPVYYIAGSHDFSPSGKTMLDIIEEAELGINVTKGNINSEEKLVLEFTTDNKTGAKITGMIGKRGMLEKKFYENLDKTNLEEAIGFKIFMFHTALDEMKPEHLKDMASSPASFLPKGFDYYAGGHVHIVSERKLPEHGYTRLVYPGPTFPANFSEIEKLGHGGYYIYEDGELKRKDLIIKKSLCKTIDVNKKTSEEAEKIIEESLEKENCEDKIVLLRINGKLKSGRANDINFKKIIDNIYSMGAYFVMKNSTKISSEEFEIIQLEHGSVEEVEEKIINEHLGQIKNNFKSESSAVKELIHILSSEKHEGEKVTDYESRLKKEMDLFIKENSE